MPVITPAKLLHSVFLKPELHYILVPEQTPRYLRTDRLRSSRLNLEFPKPSVPTASAHHYLAIIFNRGNTNRRKL